MTTQTEAERMADYLDGDWPGNDVSAELRRLVSFNQQLMDEVARLQKREWVGLTDAELNDLTAIHSGLPLHRAIEAKLRSKNHD